MLQTAHAAFFTINRLPSSVLSNKTPFEVLFSKLPDYTFLKPFGCSCFQISWHPLQINFNLDPYIVYSWAILLITKDIII